MEINPPHNGHSYFLNEINKLKNKEDLLIVVCSTTVVQRGEFSIINKYDKTQYLLDHGADLVIELPSVLANQGGYYFAKSALNLLKSFNITDLCFGSESNDLNKLQTLANYKVSQYNFKNGLYKEELSDLASNDILGISYLKNIDDPINIHLIKRIHNNYNDNFLNQSNIQSATYIRNNLHDYNICQFLDNNIYEKLYTNIDMDKLFSTFLINLDYALENNLNIFLSENQQLLYKLKKILLKNHIHNFNVLINLAQDKNNSRNKIKRLLLNIIFLIEVDKIPKQINYIHVLGFSTKAIDLIKNNQNIVTSLKNLDDYIAKKEILISQVYNYLINENLNLDFHKPLIKEKYE